MEASPTETKPPRAVVIGLVLAAVAYAVVHVIAIFRENVNWDEFVMLSHGAQSLRSGTLASSGRPGLATPLILPFARGCVEPVSAILHARILWTPITFAYLAGVYFVVREFRRGTARPWLGASLAVALLALVPV